MSTKDKNDKYEFLYNYGRAAFEDELKRFQNIEAKAGRYLSFLSVGIVAYTYMVKTYAAVFFPPSNPAEWLVLVLVAFTYFSLICSWSHLYRAIRFIEMPRLTYNYKIIEFVENADLVSVHYHFSKMAAHALELGREGNRQKSKLLTLGYKDIVLSAFLLTFSALMMTGLNLYNSKGAEMPGNSHDEKAHDDQSSQPPEPDRSLETPEVTFVLDQRDPELEKALEKINEQKRDKT